MKVAIPFQDDFRGRMLQGLKVVTSRTRRYGKQGDTFDAFGATFTFRYVMRCPLELVALLLYRAEGFTSSEDFIQCWQRLHPRKGYQADQIVYVHYFTKGGEVN